MGVSPARAQLSLGGPPDDVVEEQIEESVEEAVEEAVDDNVGDSVAEQVEDAVEEAVEERLLSLGGDGIDQSIEERFEEQVEESVEENIEEEVVDAVEDSVEEQVETIVEEEIAESITEDLEESVEETIEDAVEEVIEESVEEIVEATLEESVEQVVETSVEDSVEDSVESVVEQSVEQVVEVSVEESVEDTVEASVEQGVALAVEQGVEQSVEDSVEQGVEGEVASAIEEQIESEIDDILEGLESRLEVDESRIMRDQWLVMAEPEVFEQLAEEGYLFASVTDLPGMGMRLAEVAAPSSFDITEVRQGVIDVVGKERAKVDLNHIYTAGDPVSISPEDGVLPRDAIGFPADTEGMNLSIGMIDSGVDVTHPALAGSSIKSQSFASKGAKLPDFHGTAIASIIAANNDDYQGLAPSANVYAAAVFENDRDRGEIASTVALVRALDWLMSSGVDVVNISLAGPPNRLLETALSRAADQGVMILAAAGNGGPVAEPLFPAAYDSVVAVTAVDSAGQVYRLANRGSYLDLAAPGVDVMHARAGGGYSASSGTSFAVPFAATAAARLRQLEPGIDALEVLANSAEDLGPPGRDNIYGYGLLRPSATGAPSVATSDM
ncbi:MAG: S8 family serine peptidase [Halieaceae bacterium]